MESALDMAIEFRRLGSPHCVRLEVYSSVKILLSSSDGGLSVVPFIQLRSEISTTHIVKRENHS